MLLFTLLFEENPLIQQHESVSQNTKDTMLRYGENQKSLSHLGSDRYRDVTDKTDRITVANTRYTCSYTSSRA